MKTESVMLQNLCVPCACRCRYCLLSWDGRTEGISWERSTEYAKRFIEEAEKTCPGIFCTFTFGYAMEHPHLREAIRTLRELGSPQAHFLQCDGMKYRDEKECDELAGMLGEEGIQDLNFTFYGCAEYHDRFAGREGDHAQMIRMARAALTHGIHVSAGIPLTRENIHEADRMIRDLQEAGIQDIRLFIPHEEGRGKHLAKIRLKEEDLDILSSDTKRRLNREIYRTEKDWLCGDAYTETKRALLVSLRPDNIDRYERMDAVSLIREIEALDEAYYAAYPEFHTLAEMYGDPEGRKLYRYRDLFAHYRRQYQAEHHVQVYDVTDERYSGSRRY